MNKLRGRRGRWACVVLLAALLAVVVSGIASAEKVIVGNIEFEAEGGFKPTTLSKTKLTPIAFNAEGSIRTLDGTHPPALKEVLIEADKNTAVAVKGYPACESSKIQSTDTKHALAACEAALIGTGVTTIGIAFPDSKEVLAHSKLLIFNGGESGGVITYYIHAYITVPVPAAVVTTVKIKKIHHGRYGLLATALIPKIAGGSGSVLSFSLKIDKKFTYKGKKVSVLSAKCPDGKLQAHAVGVFADGTKAATDFVKPCTGKS